MEGSWRLEYRLGNRRWTVELDQGNFPRLHPDMYKELTELLHIPPVYLEVDYGPEDPGRRHAKD